MDSKTPDEVQPGELDNLDFLNFASPQLQAAIDADPDGHAVWQQEEVDDFPTEAERRNSPIRSMEGGYATPDDFGLPIPDSLPADQCGWVGHQVAMDEHGFCSVCQQPVDPSFYGEEADGYNMTPREEV